jgi:DDE superfamily endonuclease
MDTNIIACFETSAPKARRCTCTLDGGVSTAVEPPYHDLVPGLRETEHNGSRLSGPRGSASDASLVLGTQDRESQQSPPFCHDGTERRIQRPKDADEEIRYYSGKKKSHTVKNLVLVNRELIIEFLSETSPGRVHDKRLADVTPYPLPQGSHLLQDLGFLGFTLEGVTIEMPHKKPKGGELTDSQKETNHALSRRRIAIEHVNSSIKRLRILKDVCRLLLTEVRDCVMEISCAFHNFRLRV